ncbi:MAG: DUF2510 domain-containing protein [Acidimicrobiales bacterium]
MAANASAGWYSDPTGRYTNRYWDGGQWTKSVSGGGSNSVDALDSRERLAPPAPGTAAVGVQVSTPPPTTTYVRTETVPSSGGSTIGVVLSVVAVVFVVGLLIAIIVNNNNDSSETPTTDAPTTTAGSGDDG